MALDITINVNPAPPVEYISDAAILAQRNALADAHQVDIDPIIGFTGIYDTTGFDFYTCTSADEFETVMAIGATDPTKKKVITCNWNGVSSFTTGYSIWGPGTGNLSAYVNAGADVGYDTPPQYTKIVAGEGYTPFFGPAGGLSSVGLQISGMAFLEFNGIGFTKDLDLTRTAARPIPPIVAFKNCTLTNCYVQALEARVLHAEGNTLTGGGNGFGLGTQVARIWGNESRDKDQSGDHMQSTFFAPAYKSTWVPKIWCAGNITHSMSEVNVDPEAHFDWLQYNSVSILSIDVLIEFNLLNLAGPGSQGFFTNGVTGPYTSNICVHNNIITNMAYHNIVGKDPLGIGEINIYRNISLRGAGNNLEQSTEAIIYMLDAVDQTIPTTGAYLIKENYVNSIVDGDIVEAATTKVDNRLINTVPGANYIADVFTGNGTWSVGAFGVVYDDPGSGLSKVAAFAAIRDFFEPIGGYRVEGIGCTDPDTWPAPGAAW